MDPKTKELVTTLHSAPDRPGSLEAVRKHLMGINKPMSLVKVLEWWSGKTSNPAAGAAVLVESSLLTLDHGNDLPRAQKQLEDSIELDATVGDIAEVIDRAYADDPRARLKLLARRIELLRAKKASPSVRSEAYAHYGKTLASLGRVDKALEILEPLAARREDAADLVVKLLVHRAEKQPGTAARDRRRAVQVLRGSARRSPDNAAPLLMRALEIIPGDEAALRELEAVASEDELIPYWDAFLAQATGAPADRVAVKLARAKASTGDTLAAIALLEPLAPRMAEARNELERLRSTSKDASRVALLAELEAEFDEPSTSSQNEIDSQLDALFDDDDETTVGTAPSLIQDQARRSSRPPRPAKGGLPPLKPGSIPPPKPRLGPKPKKSSIPPPLPPEPLSIKSEPVPSAMVPSVAPMSIPPGAGGFEEFESFADTDDPPTKPSLRSVAPPDDELEDEKTMMADKRAPEPDDFFKPLSGEHHLDADADADKDEEPEPTAARPSPLPPPPEPALPAGPAPASINFAPGDLAPFGDDDEEDDEPMCDVDPARLVNAGEDAHDGPFTAEVVRLVGDTVHEVQVLRGWRRLADRSFPGKIQLKADHAIVTLDRETDGLTLTKANGQKDNLGTSPTTVQVASGARLEITRGNLRWFVRGGHSLVSGAQRREPLDLRTYGLGIGLALVVHLVSGGVVEVLSVAGVVNLEVDDRPQEEIFAEARLRPEKRPPPPRPRRPRPRRQEERPPPRETRTTLSKTLRRRMRQIQRNTRATNDTERLVERLTTPNAGTGQSISEVVTSIDGVAAAAHVAGTAGITGSLEAVSGIQVATAAGGSNVGALGGTDAASMVDMLQRRSGPVRGRVRSVSALARTSGGTLSRGEIQQVLNRAQGRIMRCYERALLSNPNLSGRISYQWTIRPNGRVGGVRQQSSTLANPGVGTCVAGVLRRLRFPRPQGGSVEVVYPFMFQVQ